MLRNISFDTYPSVVHAQGPHDHKPYWQPIRDRFFSMEQQQLTMPEDLTIITWNNGHAAMGMLEKSMEHLGLPCMVLGKEVEEWVNSVHKPLLTYQAMQSINTKYVIGIDSRDAILINDPAIILNTFKTNFDCRLVYSADILNWPNLREFKQFEDKCAEGKNTIFRYLNGGAFIGETEYCCDFFEKAVKITPLKEAERSEQGILKQLFREEYPKVQLDYHCSMFQNIGFVLQKTLEVF